MTLEELKKENEALKYRVDRLKMLLESTEAQFNYHRKRAEVAEEELASFKYTDLTIDDIESDVFDLKDIVDHYDDNENWHCCEEDYWYDVDNLLEK